MIWFLYNVLFTIGYLFLLPKFFLRMWRRGGYRSGFMQRFGVYSAEVRARLAQRERTWIHAVSVGEIYVALRFMEELRATAPETAFVLSTTTSTGHQVARKAVSDPDVLIYFPIDIPLVVRRALKAIRPRVLLLTENELWPNLLRALKRKHIPVALINGRISASSYRGYRLVRWVTRRALRLVDVFLVQSGEDAKRLCDLGADPARVATMGSAKYDVVKDDPEAPARAAGILARAGIDVDEPVLLGGSTWPGEERILLGIYRDLKRSFSELKLVLVPRHMERRAAVEAEILRAGIRHVCRSRLPPAPPDPAPECLLVDTTGELKTLYAAASVIFVGKSLTQTGGQNIIEPALFGKPIVVGPHLENFPDVAEEFRCAEAMIQVADATQLADEIESLLADRGRCAAYGRRARDLVERKRGVITASIRRLTPLWGAAGQTEGIQKGGYR